MGWNNWHTEPQPPEDKPEWLALLESDEALLKRIRDDIVTMYQVAGIHANTAGKDGAAGHAADALDDLEEKLGELVDTVNDLIGEFSDRIEKLEHNS